ncbi:hypothetical protein [Rossellomorea marisflavi]|uniref:hypothetical protein n=1 Tax=Rossellomorea marisflavi TaxID=189381 RepID=UPI00064FD0CD|nr:hypothetical protein [Rossellomorea marisflavi]KML00582.1 hypothetical protein VL06_20915 [Rossellomorea marisflavi]
MRGLAITGGLLGIIFPLFAQLFAVIDDSYVFGNIGFLGVISGIVALIGAYRINKNNKLASVLLILSAVVGYYAVANIYLVPGLFSLISGIVVVKRKIK